MIRAFAIGLFQLYFWYMFQHRMPSNPSKPTTEAPTIPPTRTFNHYFDKNGINLSLIADSVGTWTIPIPLSVTFRNNRLFPRDACHNQPVGASIAASRPLLYDYVWHDCLQPLVK
ncbi:hypothetical protein AVEN_76882-1 [Araneus ventricosus]|uniref:Uncharacterized protein n=1 Tax=Araneus ventricosus TaxID=182803 RepID=A0A4Y2Q2E5_ARAVE|nr:hypothetical protein AVEN_76882-1 [Araneus ventricosus]